VLYHGTSAANADRIAREGLVPGLDGRAYLTTAPEVAWRYAMGAAMRAAIEPPPPAIFTEVGARARELGGHAGVVIAIDASAVRLDGREYRSGPPPLPWETRRHWADVFVTGSRVDPSAFLALDMQRITPLDGVTYASPRRAAIIDELAREGMTHRRRFVDPGDRCQPISAPLCDVLPSPTELLALAHTRPDSPVHGTGHALGVAAAGVRLLQDGCGADPAVLLAFAVLHDAARRHDGHDPDHGTRAADTARRLAGIAHRLTAAQLDVLCAALVDHDRGFTSADATIGACWDADRLTLPRVGIQPDPARMSTDAGRALTADLDHIPTPEHTDWHWIVDRYAHLSQPADAVAQRARALEADLADLWAAA